MKGYEYYLNNFFSIFFNKLFKGWGRKKTGRFASWCHKKFGGTIKLYEDGFIRSVDLGVGGSPSFSIIEDDVGIYYDATAPSKLENLLNSYNFDVDTALMDDAKKAIAFIKRYNISKYNNAPDIDDGFRMEYGMTSDHKRVLIIAQTAGDASLEYGMLDDYTTNDMIFAAFAENPGAKVYLKVHPEVLTGKKKSDIDITKLHSSVQLITENVNTIALLKHFDKVYTKTSGMGLEALLVGCECVCFGMPFYAGWGITDNRSKCERRKRNLSVEEVFAAAYILYTRYVNPYTIQECDIFEVMEEIVRRRDVLSYGSLSPDE